MRALLPEPADDVDVHAWYAAGWLSSGGVRANFVASADGAATVEGRSGGLGGAADRKVFHLLRGLDGGVLKGVGALNHEPASA